MEVSNLPKGPGIYNIYNVVTNKMYIGSSINLQQRLFKHRAYLRKKIHQNPHLQNSWNKYGEEFFTCSILELCSVESLIEKEQYYINKIKPQYNVVTNVIRPTLPEESIKRMRQTLKTKYKTGDIISVSKKVVYQYDLNGEFLKSFDSIQEAANHLGYNRSCIDRAIHGEKDKNIRTGAGYQWSLIKYDKLNKIEITKAGISKRSKPWPTKPLKVIDILLKQTIVFKSHKEASKFFKVKGTAALQRPIKGKYLFRKRFYIAPVKQEELLETPQSGQSAAELI